MAKEKLRGIRFFDTIIFYYSKIFIDISNIISLIFSLKDFNINEKQHLITYGKKKCLHL